MTARSAGVATDATALRAAAHDLRAPLGAASACAESLVQCLGPRLEEDEQLVVARLLQSIQRMGEVIDSAMGHDPSDAIGPVDLDRVMMQVLQDLAGPLRDADASVEVDRLGSVTGRPVELGRLLQNVLRNSIDHGQPDVCLEVRVWAERVQDEHRIVVRDNGPGVPVHVMHRVLDPSYIPGPDDRMGLYICVGIVRRHGGRLWIQPADGGGTEVWIALPCSRT